jgi:hypothetical protein
MSGMIDGLAKHLQERVNKAEARVAELEEALRPFADGHRKIERMLPIPHGLGYHGAFTMQDLARAAELVPERQE